MSLIEFNTENNVAFIVLNRPEVFNSINKEVALRFQKILQICETNKTIRAIVISGKGKGFCAGQDLKEVVDSKEPFEFKKTLEEHYNPIIKLLRKIKKPIIAAVNGVAAGAGANIALACDIVIASEKASFIQAFSSIGLIPDSGGSFFLPKLIGFQKALALAMLGDKVSSKEAERIGMIYKVFPEKSFEIETKKIALKLANMPTLALGMMKDAFNKSLVNDLEAQLNLETDFQIKASLSEDYKEGISAFLEKRQPKFKGK